MKAVVTGGAGFIGSHLVDLLIEKGFRVEVIDNLATGNEKNIGYHKNNENFVFHKIDVSDFGNFHKICKIVENADLVFHLAALADIVPSIEKPTDYHKANVNGTIAMLEACRNTKIKKFVYTASSSCYGIAETPTKEDAPINPEYPYALTKYIGEQYVLSWNRLYGIPSISLRLFNVYGPRSRTKGAYGAVFGVFLAQKLNNQPLTVVGDGSQTRDFTFVSDVADALYLAADSDLTGEAINIGSGETNSINRLVKLLGGDVVNIPKRPGEPDCTFADITKARELLNYNPKISFEQGVKDVLKRIEDWRDAPVWTPDQIEVATREWFKNLSHKN